MRRIVGLVVLAVSLFVSPAESFARVGPEGFADLTEKLLPSVVNISTKQTIVQDDVMREFEFNFPEGSPFEDFFKEFRQHRLPKQPPQNRNDQGEGSEEDPAPRKHKVSSLGSGFIIDPKGYIVTNLHVIQDAEEISVILQDDTNLPATVVGRDKKTDLAVLKVTTDKPLVAASFGDSDKVRVGDWILAIGNPFGLGGTVTTGIISARARDINSGPYDDYLQTDAPINRGNSGGPMFDMDGQVIGVNTAIYSPSGGSVGIGFAIPSTIAKNVVTQLIEHGVTKRGWIGVRIQDVTPDIAKSLALGKARGALVSNVTPDGPADKAGVKMGDVILTYDGRDVVEMHKLPRLVADTDIGKTVPMTIYRGGRELNLQVKIGRLDQSEDTETKDKTPAGAKEKTKSEKIETLGLNVAPLSDEMRKRYKVGKTVQGIVVTAVTPQGLADEYGLRPGDIIAQAAQTDVTDTQNFANLVETHKKKEMPLLLLIDRDGDPRFLAIPLGKKK